MVPARSGQGPYRQGGGNPVHPCDVPLSASTARHIVRRMTSSSQPADDPITPRQRAKAELRGLGWFAYGWIVGLLVLVGLGPSDDLSVVLGAVAAAVAVPLVSWLLVHRRWPKIERRTTPYGASDAIASLLGCATFPAISRSLTLSGTDFVTMWLL